MSLPDWTDGDGETHPGKKENTRKAKILPGKNPGRQEASGSAWKYIEHTLAATTFRRAPSAAARIIS